MLDRRSLLTGLAGTFGLAAAGLEFAIARRNVPLVAVRDRPLELEGGRIGADLPLVQRIAAPNADVARCEVAVVGDAGPEVARGELTVRAAEGATRTAPGFTVRGLHRETRHVAFRFDPPVPAGGGEWSLELRGPRESDAPPLVPFLRPAGGLGRRHDFGRDPLTQREHVRLVRADVERFSGVAVPIQAAEAADGPLELLVFAADRPIEGPSSPQPLWSAASEPSADEPLRRARLERVPRLVLGHLPLRFAPIEDSLGRTYDLRLSTPDGLVVAGNYDGFAFVPLFGDALARPPFRGLALGEVTIPHADLALSLWP